MSSSKTKSIRTGCPPTKRVAAALVVSIFVYPVVVTITYYVIGLLQKFAIEHSLSGLLGGLVAPFSGWGASIMLVNLILFLVFPTPGFMAYFAFRTFFSGWIGWKEVALVALALGLVSWIPQSWFHSYYEGPQISYAWLSIWWQTWRAIPVALASAFAALCCWKILRMTGVLQRIVKVTPDTEATS